MLYKIAIIPEIFVSDDFRTLDRELDFLWDYIFDNCLIIIPRNNIWIDSISAINMPSKLREKTFRYLRRVKDANRFIVTNTSLNDGDWYEWGARVYSDYSLHAVVMPQKKRVLYKSKDERVIDFPVTPSQDVLLELKRSKCQISQTTEEDLEKTLKPILEYARILRVIDPYISSTKSWSQSSIEIASKLLGCSLKKEHSYTCKFEIYISEGKAKKSGLTKKQARESRELMTVWEPIWEIVRKEGHSFRVVVFGNDNNQKELHDRFILTDQCGVMLSTGFSCDTPAHPQVWIMLPENSFRAITDLFIFNSPYPVRSQFQFPHS